MDHKIVILKIVKENQPIGIHKFDRLFYDKVDFSVPWPPLMAELRNEGMVETVNGYLITKKGERYLNQNSTN